MSDLKNDRFIRALLKQPVDTTPIWMMRQAGRYLPEYREIRAQAGSFMNLCTNPELACEVTLQPLERFDFDAAILFSDILTIPDAMGLGLYFTEGEGPRFKNPVRTAADIEKLPIPDPEIELKYVIDAVRLIRKNLQGRVPLIGFSGSPWTLATYMVEGSSSKTFSKVKGLMFEQPHLMHKMLDKLAQSVAVYLNAQIAAGAQTVMLFDTWGGSLGTEEYLEFSLRYAQQVRALLNTTQDGQQIPTILFTKGGGQWLLISGNIPCPRLNTWPEPAPYLSSIVETFDLITSGFAYRVMGSILPCNATRSPTRARARWISVCQSSPSAS
jgi:uroporphyrinogen decarboxylase